jgi:hypothetical protein
MYMQAYFNIYICMYIHIFIYVYIDLYVINNTSGEENETAGRRGIGGYQ